MSPILSEAARTARLLPLVRFTLPVLVCTGLFLATAHLQAQSTLYWDSDGLGTVGGGTGTWNTSSANWSPTAAGSTYQAWGNASNDIAVFQNTAGTVTLGSNDTASSLTFGVSGYTIAPDAGNLYSITLTGTHIINTGTFDTVISAPITGSVGLAKFGSGTLSLSGPNTYTGGTTVRAGTLAVSTGGAIAHPSQDTIVGLNNGDVATLQVASGGTVSNTNGNLGYSVGSKGTADVTGTWTNSGQYLFVGVQGMGALTIQNTGTVNSANGYVGDYSGSTGTANVHGTWTNSGDLFVGYYGTGALTIRDSGTVSNTYGYIGYGSGSSGTLDVAGTWNNSAYVDVGRRGTGALTILATGTVTSPGGYLGLYSSGSGTADVAGVWNNSDVVEVGGWGSGALTIRNTGTVSNTSGYIGGESGGIGVANIAGTWSNTGPLYVGFSGTGALTILATGTVSSTAGYLGLYSGSGSADVAGAWNSSGVVDVGGYGSGALTIRTTGTVSNTDGDLGGNTGSSGTADVAGTWTNTGGLYVGNYGTGTLTIRDGGKVNVNSGGTTVRLAYGPGSSGTLHIGAGGAAGILNTATVNGGAGAATLNFNHNDPSYYFTKDGTSAGAAVLITGSTAVNQIGSGTTILKGTNTYSGATTISAGGLIVNGSANNSAFTVSSGGTLGGSGSLGTLTIASGGTLSPGNSPGTLSAGATTFAGGGSYVWEINSASGIAGTNWDLLSISGALAITATSGSPFTIDLTSLTAGNIAGNAANFDPAASYYFTFATASGGITGFSAAAFTLDASDFSNPYTGSWSIAQSGNDLNLVYSGGSVPEPSSYAALFGAAALAFAFVRRRRKLIRLNT